MSNLYCKIDLARLAIVGAPGPLPSELRGTLSDADLADLSWTDETLGLHGYGFWPVERAAATYDPATQRLSGEVSRLPDADRRVVVETPLVVELTDEELAARLTVAKAERKAAATAKRWEVEVAGTIVNGIPVATDDRSKTLILGKRAQAQADPDMTFRWKAVNGWVELSGAQIIAIADAVADHVQACFDREGELHDAIDAAKDAAAVLAVDITAGWPVQ
ncbi:DUF4376 domain-containing protein [Azospirillum sp. A1-3]|uniref:DUF4376 domain-containing protein n=1 Tax=Azospirillum sp. A1-3 TaxID=185874 RepID=UPI00207780E8|nr:DUF4376 domain-containing protein [Azospirillum sp. A1-3]MCM8738276.1 DUF4376 domain-containing protein [Azospirillum sp. A1-3]